MAGQREGLERGLEQRTLSLGLRVEPDPELAREIGELLGRDQISLGRAPAHGLPHGERLTGAPRRDLVVGEHGGEARGRDHGLARLGREPGQALGLRDGRRGDRGELGQRDARRDLKHRAAVPARHRAALGRGVDRCAAPLTEQHAKIEPEPGGGRRHLRAEDKPIGMGVQQLFTRGVRSLRDRSRLRRRSGP